MKKIVLLLFGFMLYALDLPSYFSANFTQKVNEITYKGKVFFHNQKAFWEYTYPTTKKVWIDEKMVYIYEPDLMQVIISKKPELNLEQILKNAKKEKNYYVAEVNGKKIYFVFDKTLKEAWYNDDFGNKIVIEFHNQSTKKFDSSILEPNFPNDVDIIYQ